MTTTANGLHQRRAAGEQKECNKGMMQRKTGATTLAAPGGDVDQYAICCRPGCYQFSNAILLQVLAAVQT